jgi:hypothetical protein
MEMDDLATSEYFLRHRGLLEQVVARLHEIGSRTDYALLTTWRVLSICLAIVDSPSMDDERYFVGVLEQFLRNGLGGAPDRALRNARLKLAARGEFQGLLPLVSSAKREEVNKQLNKLFERGRQSIDDALLVLPDVLKRFRRSCDGVPVPGMKYRLEIAARLVLDEAQAEEVRRKIASAILYIDRKDDVIPDSLGMLGLLDDDYALTEVLQKAQVVKPEQLVHWTERISNLWIDLPFLKGLQLMRGDMAVDVNWLDRANAYYVHSHVFGHPRTMLLLLLPSIAVRPLYSIVALIGLSVLDAITSAMDVTRLRVGQKYAFDRHVAVYEGVGTDPLLSGWLRLRFRDGHAYGHQTLERQMIAVEDRALTDAGAFTAAKPGRDPLRRFFDWEDSIGAATLSAPIALVMTRIRAHELLDGIQSNGVKLLDHGFVRFIGESGESRDCRGALLLVVPSTAVARQLLDKGVPLQVIFIDGYDNLRRSRHDLPFLKNNLRAVPLIAWVPSGYVPTTTSSWLSEFSQIAVSGEDLAALLEVENDLSLPEDSALWISATGIEVDQHTVVPRQNEVALSNAIHEFRNALYQSEEVPEFARFHLGSMARAFGLLVMATPAQWVDIRRANELLQTHCETIWQGFRPGALRRIDDVRKAAHKITEHLHRIDGDLNSIAVGLEAVLSVAACEYEPRYIVCDTEEQSLITSAYIRNAGLQNLVATILKNLPTARSCIATGWVGRHFASRLRAHTPSKLMVVAAHSDVQEWVRAMSAPLQKGKTGSLLDSISLRHSIEMSDENPPVESVLVDDAFPDISFECVGDLRACVCVFVDGRAEVKVVAEQSKIFVEEEDGLVEQRAVKLCIGGRAVFGRISSRWEPAEEFTEAVVAAVGSSNPHLIESAREWRRGLRMLIDATRSSAADLRTMLVSVGIERETQTLEGWLDLTRAAPIAPRSPRLELERLWPMISSYVDRPLDVVLDSCGRLRSLRNSAGRALLRLWKGGDLGLDIDAELSGDLMERLRRDVEVYEIVNIRYCAVPASLIGYWVSPELLGDKH